ncbi:MAG: smalltalk protein [Bacteroidales bacterium]|nr:smalltalk protein [Bacteroidales bacterium]
MKDKQKIVELVVKVIVSALTAFLTALTATSCMGHGPIYL